MPTEQKDYTLDWIFNVACTALGKGEDTNAALGLIIAICRYQRATPFTNEENARFNPFGN